MAGRVDAATDLAAAETDLVAAQTDLDGLVAPTGLYASLWSDVLVETVWAHSRTMFAI